MSILRRRDPVVDFNRTEKDGAGRWKDFRLGECSDLRNVRGSDVQSRGRGVTIFCLWCDWRPT